MTSNTRNMGIWKDVDPFGAHYSSLTEVALKCGYLTESSIRGYRIGINAGTWIRSACATHTEHSGQLRLLFNQLAHLSSSLTNVIFVLDGPGFLSDTPQNIVDLFSRMVDDFSFHMHKAPDEAEAELAAMNRIGVIDAILTANECAFLYGAVRVIRQGPGHSFDNVILFDTQVMYQENRVSRGSMLLTAMTYNLQFYEPHLTKQQMAHSLARYGLGEQLLYAIQDLDGDALATFITGWRGDVIERLRHDPLGYIGRPCPALADSLPLSFPDVKMAQRFVRPDVSTSQTLHGHAWSFRVPDATRILQLCIQHFRSPVGNIMFSLVRRDIERGIALRILLTEAAIMEADDAGFGPFIPTSRPQNKLDLKIEGRFQGYQYSMMIIRAQLLKLPTSSDDTFTFKGRFSMIVPPTLLLRARPQCRQELYSILYRGVDPAILHCVTVQYFTPQRATTSAASSVIDLTGDDDADDPIIDLTLDDDNTTI